jgi:hypothetical protein
MGQIMEVVSIGIINILLGFFLKHKIEKVKFKNSQNLLEFNDKLNLINKKLQKYQLEQVDTIKELYSILIDIKYSTNSLFNKKFNSSPHYEFKNKLNKWVSDYMRFHEFFSRNKILLSEKLINLTREDLDNLHKIFSIVFKKVKDIEEMEEIVRGQINYLYEDKYAEESEILSELEKLKVETEKEVKGFKFMNLIEALEIEYRNLLS